MAKFVLALFLIFTPLSALHAQTSAQERYPDSHWDVYEVTNQNWKKLSDSQKFQFVVEAYQELLKTHQDVSIGIRPDHEKGFWEDVAFLDQVIKSVPQTKGTFPMVAFYFETLKMQKRVKYLGDQ